MGKIIIANWKAHPASVAEATELAKATDREGIVICPPNNFLKDVAEVVEEGKLGAQDLFWQGKAPDKVEYVIIGHSDRRKLGETNEAVARKFKKAIEAGLIPILCVGETLEQKQKGKKEEIIKEEILSAFAQFKILNLKFKIYVAYEPIWAISTSKNAEPDKPENTLETIRFIKSLLQPVEIQSRRVGFLYGGSVTSQNAESFLRCGEIEGALVGGASLKPKEINKIVDIAEQY